VFEDFIWFVSVGVKDEAEGETEEAEEDDGVGHD